jgi:hypothetical protein
MIVASDGLPRIGRITVGTTAQQLSISGQMNSQGFLLKVLGDSSAVYLGATANVSSKNSWPILSGEEFSLNLRDTESLWIVADEQCEVAYMAL